MSKLKMSYLCFLVMLVGATLPMAFGEGYLTNGDFATDTSGWTLMHGEDTDMAAVWDGTVDADDNVASGSAKLYRMNTSASSNSHKFFQTFAVTPGKTYQLQGKWKGDLKSAEPGTGGRNWIEVFVAYTDTPVITPATLWSGIQYKKRFDNNDPGDCLNIDPVTGEWGWEDIADSASGAPEEGFEAPDGMAYMTFGFNLGGSDDATISYAPDQVKLWIDNIEITACQGYPEADLDGDCAVTLADFAILSETWMKCELDPQSACSL